MDSYLSNMKYLTLCAVSLLVSVQICSADLLQDIVGKWTLNGTPRGTEITTVFKKSGQKGLKRTSTIIIPGLPESTGVTQYKANGTVRGKLKLGGILPNTYTGTWRIKGNKLIENVVISSPHLPDSRQNTKVTLTPSNKLKTVSVLNGDRTTGTLSRSR